MKMEWLKVPVGMTIFVELLETIRSLEMMEVT